MLQHQLLRAALDSGLYLGFTGTYSDMRFMCSVVQECRRKLNLDRSIGDNLCARIEAEIHFEYGVLMGGDTGGLQPSTLAYLLNRKAEKRKGGIICPAYMKSRSRRKTALAWFEKLYRKLLSEGV